MMPLLPLASSVQREAMERLQRMLQFRQGNLDWARRILEREARGEPVEFRALECAREALREMHAEREPGEDGAEHVESAF